MNSIQQHSVMQSMEQALTAPGQLIDGRTEKDWLHFIAQFAALVNFYDQYNRQLGNWEPFVLKDPVFLLATVSKTDVQTLQGSYKNIHQHINRLLQRNASSPAVGEAMNRLFDTLVKAFLNIRRWVYYMQLSGENYPLKTYTVGQVKTSFARYFQAIISLRQNLFLSASIPGITPVNHDELYLFDAVDGMIWKEHRDKSPCWEVLGLEYPLKTNTAEQVVAALAKTGNELFAFMNSVVQQASAGYELLRTKTSRFPDTLLLRTFINMMQVHRNQLNGITGRHLRFCYKDVLKLQEKPAGSDTVFLCATTITKDQVLTIPAGTMFDAGVDAQKNPVTFTATEDARINPAFVSNIYSVSAVKGSDGRFRIYRDQNAKPGKVQVNEDGQIQTWKTFGGTVSPTSVKLSQAISFASPMLLLREGIRNITITIGFTGTFDIDWLQDVQYYLSTQAAWLPVKASLTQNENAQAVLSIMLDEAQPPIEPFIKNPAQKDPDGLESAWPLFKMEFGSFADPATSPVISTLKIETTVQGIKTLQLYNDFGPVDVKAPFPLFGPTPLQNSGFMIGSSEIFSKPLDMAQIEMAWDKLPEDFSAYYKEYNLYIEHINEVNAPPPKKKGIVRRVWDGIKNFFRTIWNWITSLFRKKKEEIKKCPYYYNKAFGVDISMMPQNESEAPGMVKAAAIGADGGKLTWTPYEDDPRCGCQTEFPVPASQQLFGIDGETCKTITPGYYVYDRSGEGVPSFNPDPNIQQTVLEYTGHNHSGFMKMSLKNPGYGFGSSIYPDLVSWIAMQNAWLLYNSQPDTDLLGFKKKEKQPKFIEAAKLPFVPKLAGIKMHYAATQEYRFDNETGAYPVQCFYYTAVRNYKIFDNRRTAQEQSLIPGLNTDTASGIPMFRALGNEGNLFIELDALIPASELSFYFEMGQSFHEGANPVDKPVLAYLSNTGWKELPILADGTNNLSCSGVLRVHIPGDISNAGLLMPGDKYWVAATLKTGASTAAAMAFLQTNGFSAQRVMDAAADYTIAPVLAANTIAQTRSSFPQIEKIVQPFPSFDGKPSETENVMLVRGATRMKTKDRAVTPGDYYMLISRQFPGIYYSKAVLNKKDKSIRVFVVKSVSSEQEAHAFEPLVSGCTLNHIKGYLAERASGAQAITASNFNLQVVQVNTTVQLNPGFAPSGVQKNITRAIKIFCAPWIQDNGIHATTGEPLTDALLMPVIRNVTGVADVLQVTFTTWKYDEGMPANPTEAQLVQPLDETYLMIPATEHNIQCILAS